MPDKYTSMPGAETALAFIALQHEWPGDLDAERWTVRYSTYRWSYETRKFEEVDPHFTSHVDCSDTFFWGSADAEEVTDETLPILRDVMEELKPYWKAADAEVSRLISERSGDALLKWIEGWKTAHPTWEADGLKWNESEEHKLAKQPESAAWKVVYGVEAALQDLYAARVRKMRPQGACYSRYPEDLWPLFDAAGPEREVGLGNPYEPGQYKN